MPNGNNNDIYEVVGNSSVVFKAIEKLKYSLWLGYIIIAIASVSITFESNVIRLLVDQYSPTVVLF